MDEWLNEWMNVEPSPGPTDGVPEVLGENPVPLPLCPTQISRILARDRSPAPAARGRPPTAWGIGRTNFNIILTSIPRPAVYIFN